MRRLVRGSASSHASHFFWNDSSPTASTSSVIRRSGDNAVATAKPRRTIIPDEYCLIGWLMCSPMSAKAMISSRRASISFAPSPINAAAQIDVLEPRVFGMKARAQLEERRDIPGRLDCPVRRSDDAGDDLQQRRLSCAVFADDRDGIAAPDIQAHILERAKDACAAAPAQQIENQLQPRRRLVDRRVVLARAGEVQEPASRRLGRFAGECSGRRGHGVRGHGRCDGTRHC